MTAAALRAGTFAVSSAPPFDHLTHVELTHIERRVENWIRFGRHVGERIVDRRRRVLSFRPGSVFAFVRWAANDYGTTASRIDIVRPGGEVLLHVDGWPKVERVLRHIDAVEATGVDPCDAAPDHWRHAHNRIATGEEPRAYTAERHRAWLKRREIER
jgi:hypothetical protein